MEGSDWADFQTWRGDGILPGNLLSLSPSLLLKEEADSPTKTPPTDDDVADL